VVATAIGHQATILKLLELGADPAWSSAPYTPADFGAASFVVRSNRSINPSSLYPLSIAASTSTGRPGIVTALLQRGADPNFLYPGSRRGQEPMYAILERLAGRPWEYDFWVSARQMVKYGGRVDFDRLVARHGLAKALEMFGMLGIDPPRAASLVPLLEPARRKSNEWDGAADETSVGLTRS
jgi:hypothetical protein